MKSLFAGLLVVTSLSAFAGEEVKCKVIDLPNLGSENPTTFTVDVSENTVDIKLAEFDGDEGYKLSVNVLKRSLDKNYILDCHSKSK